MKLNLRCTRHLSSYVIWSCYFSGSRLNTQALRSDLSHICQTRLITAGGRGGTPKQRRAGWFSSDLQMLRRVSVLGFIAENEKMVATYRRNSTNVCIYMFVLF